MKRVFFTIFVFSVMIISANAQVAFSVYSSVGRSSFDKNILSNSVTDLAEFSQAEYIPVGAQLTFSLPFLLTFGADVNYAAVPFTFNVNADVLGQNIKVSELKVHQFMAGVFVKARLLPGPVVPYAKVGAGLISGNIDINWTDQLKQLASQYGFMLKDSTINIKNAVRVNLGAGVEINFSQSGGLFGELVYNLFKGEKILKEHNPSRQTVVQFL